MGSNGHQQNPGFPDVSSKSWDFSSTKEGLSVSNVFGGGWNAYLMIRSVDYDKTCWLIFRSISYSSQHSARLCFLIFLAIRYDGQGSSSYGCWTESDKYHLQTYLHQKVLLWVIPHVLFPLTWCWQTQPFLVTVRRYQTEANSSHLWKNTFQIEKLRQQIKSYRGNKFVKILIITTCTI